MPSLVARFAAIGLVSGFFGALFGVGGGIVIVPLLMLAAGFSQRPAMATSLAAISATALAGTIGYAVEGRVDVALGALVGVPAAGGAVTGAWLQQRLHGRGLGLAFACLLAVVGITLLVR